MAVGSNACRTIWLRPSSFCHLLSLEESQESSGSAILEVVAFARDLLAAYYIQTIAIVLLFLLFQEEGAGPISFVKPISNSPCWKGQSEVQQDLICITPSRRSPCAEWRAQCIASAGVAGADHCLLVEYESKKAAPILRKWKIIPTHGRAATRRKSKTKTKRKAKAKTR
jgi:hypothetical protein